jgi:hypothetical protein
MAQHLSIEALLQQFNQLELTSEAQLEQLLRKVESNKTELPVEDHSIIDWGIGFIRAKIHEEERIRKEMCKELDLKYKSYEGFLRESGWERVNLALEDQKEKWFKESFSNLYEIVKKTDSSGLFPVKAKDYGTKLRGYVSRFCTQQGLSDAKVIKAYAHHCDQRASDLKQSDNDVEGKIRTAQNRKNMLKPQDNAQEEIKDQLEHLESLKAFPEPDRKRNAEYWERLAEGLREEKSIK